MREQALEKLARDACDALEEMTIVGERQRAEIASLRMEVRGARGRRRRGAPSTSSRRAAAAAAAAASPTATKLALMKQVRVKKVLAEKAAAAALARMQQHGAAPAQTQPLSEGVRGAALASDLAAANAQAAHSAHASRRGAVGRAAHAVHSAATTSARPRYASISVGGAAERAAAAAAAVKKTATALPAPALLDRYRPSAAEGKYSSPAHFDGGYEATERAAKALDDSGSALSPPIGLRAGVHTAGASTLSDVCATCARTHNTPPSPVTIAFRSAD